MGSSRWRRRLLVISGCLALVVILITPLLPKLATPWVRAKLQSAVSDQLNAQLSFDQLEYLFPYGVRVHQAKLVANDPRGRPFDLLTADQIELKLAKLPILPGPLVIERLIVTSPAVHLIQTEDGLVGRGITKKTDQPLEQRKQKLSEMFELRKVAVTNAQLIYDDRTVAANVPLAWRNLSLDLNTTPQSAASYQFDINAGDQSTATLSANGAFDIDELLLKIVECGVRVNVDPTSPDSPIPGELQRVLRDYQVKGSIAVEASGDLPLTDPRRAKLVAKIDLPNAVGRLPGANAPLDSLSAQIHCTADPNAVKVQIDRIIAKSHDTSLELTLPSAIFNQDTRAVGVSDFKVKISTGKNCSGLPQAIAQTIAQLHLGGDLVALVNGSGPTTGGWHDFHATCSLSPENVAIQIPQLPEALHDFAPFTVDLTNGMLTLGTVRAGYGNDVFFIREARVPLEMLPQKLFFDKLAGCITFAAQRAKYPPTVEEYVAHAQPRGPFFFDGNLAIDRSTTQPTVDYHVRVTTDRVALAPLKKHLPLYNVAADVLVTPHVIAIDRFDADTLAGKLSTTGRIKLDRMVAYSGAVRLRRIDLNELAHFATGPDVKPLTISGELSADINYSGQGSDESALDALKADGALQISRGDLFHIPLLEGIVQRMGKDNAATVGDAAATFTLADRVIHLNDAAVGSPAVGVHGAGTVGLDDRLDLNLVATPLSDWERTLRREDDNAVANIAANVAGAVQRKMNQVTEQYLYRIHVTGTTDEPKIDVIAAPALQSAKN
jgi:hypothetical protein